MTDDLFTHDPTHSREVPADDLTSFEQAKAALDGDDADGLGFVVTRHDPFLVLEVANGRVDDNLVPTVERILSALGRTFTEADEKGLIRSFYRGDLPGNFHGSDPVVVTIGGEDRNHAFRFFDSGWTPVTTRHIPGTPEEIKPIDTKALRRLLSYVEED